MSPQKPHVKVLIPNVMVFGGGGLWEILGLGKVKRVKPQTGISTLLRGRRETGALSLHHVRTGQEGSHP